MLDARYQPFSHLAGGELVVNPDLVADVRQVADSANARFFLYVGGSEHVRWGLINDPRPFDCVTPGFTDDTEPTCGEVFPYEMLVALGQHAAEYLTVPLAFLRTVTDRPIYQLCPPPPLRSTDLARINIDPVLHEGVERHGIAPDPFRVRIWQICVEGLRRACRAVGHDAVHANVL